MKRSQAGFTLIEIAIVLVIIGLLLGGVLKGQALIDSAKVKNLAEDFRNVPVFVFSYQDKFRSLPGDDASVSTHLSTATAASTPADKQGNGAINGNWNSSTTTDETFLFWQHVRLAGLTQGATSTVATNYLPKNTLGGALGVSSTTPITNLKGAHFVCSDAIPGKYAVELDIALDDGNTATGGMMTTTLGTTTAAAAIAAPAADTTYLVCMGF